MIESGSYRVASGKRMFVNLFDQLEVIHNKGFVLGEIIMQDIKKDENNNWNLLCEREMYQQGTCIFRDKDHIGWKRQSRAPEYRNACLNGLAYYPTKTGDIYSLVYNIYTIIIGAPPSLNFQLNRHWAKSLENAFECVSDEKKVALQSLFDRCTQVSEYHRIQSCEQLKRTIEYQLLFSN